MIGNMTKNQSQKKLTGLTLIEVLVALSVFVLTLTALIQIYISSLRAERLAYSLLNAENSVRYALELMARDIRMGAGFSADGSSLSFTSYYGGNENNVIYRLDNKRLKRNEVFITPSSIVIEPLGTNAFIVYQDSLTQQPFVTIKLKASITERGKTYTFPLETSVAPRIFNISNP